MNKQIHVLKSQPELIAAASELIATAVTQAVHEHGKCAVALAGGNTPRAVYEALASENYGKIIPWRDLHLFWGDERMVPPDHELSNFRMANEAWLQHVQVPVENIHRIKGELAPAEAARDYRAEMQRYFKNRAPSFDLILLGLGEDGHTASIFPQTDAVFENSQTAIAVFAPQMKQWRVTLTLPVINQARKIVFLVAGKAKAQIGAAVLQLEKFEIKWPASMVQPIQGDLHWLLDADAASLLS
ncbi:MAG: 6-phosphogluconolactonase [bacterium]